MKTFKQLRESYSNLLDESTVKTFKVGKGNKYTAVIKKEGSRFVAYIDGDKLDSFKSEKEAEKAAKDFTDLMGN